MQSLDLRQPLHPLAAARSVTLKQAATLCGCDRVTLRRAAKRGELTVCRLNARVIRVHLVDLALWYLTNARSCGQTTTKRVGRPWRALSVTTR